MLIQLCKKNTMQSYGYITYNEEIIDEEEEHEGLTFVTMMLKNN